MKKLTAYIAAVILVLSIVATMMGYNHFIQSIGFLSAGFLFGSAPAPTTNGPSKNSSGQRI